MNRALIGVFASVLVAMPAMAAKHNAKPPTAPAHNFVNYDLTASVPAPLQAGSLRTSVLLFDTAAPTRNGDAVTFETLKIWRQYGHFTLGTKEVGGPTGSIQNTTNRYEASCAWRTLRELPGPAQNGFPDPILGSQPIFLRADSGYLPLIDRLCNGQPLDAAKGFPTAEAATTAWKDDFTPLGHLPIPAPSVSRTVTADPWMDGTAPHRFVFVATDAATGNMLYLDRGNLAREGQVVTALSFALLGPEAQIFSPRGMEVAVLRRARYDCAAHTMTVTAQASFDRFETLTGRSENAFAPRSTGVEIDAACSDSPEIGSALASTDAAWDEARTHWPQSPYAAWASCLWAHLPEARRTAFTTQWTNGEAPTDAEADSALAACDVPSVHNKVALHLLFWYSTQRFALHRLADRNVYEGKIAAAWHALPGADLQQALRAPRGLVVGKIGFEQAPNPAQPLANAVADELHVSRQDKETWTWLFLYATSALALEAGE
jgi:hypothetical protein